MAAGGGERREVACFQGRVRSSHRGPSSSGTPRGEGGALLPRSVQHMDVKQGKCRHGAIVLLDTRSVIILWQERKAEPSHTSLLFSALVIALSCSFFLPSIWGKVVQGATAFFFPPCCFIAMLIAFLFLVFLGYGCLLPWERRWVRPPCWQPQRGRPLHHLHLLSQQRLGCQGTRLRESAARPLFQMPSCVTPTM